MGCIPIRSWLLDHGVYIIIDTELRVQWEEEGSINFDPRLNDNHLKLATTMNEIYDFEFTIHRQGVIKTWNWLKFLP